MPNVAQYNTPLPSHNTTTNLEYNECQEDYQFVRCCVPLHKSFRYVNLLSEGPGIEPGVQQFPLR